MKSAACSRPRKMSTVDQTAVFNQTAIFRESAVVDVDGTFLDQM